MAELLTFPLIPTSQGLTPEEDLEGAVASALNTPTVAAPPAPMPYGRSWAFDFVNRHMIRRGDSPAEVEGADTLIMWCLMAVYAVRYAHAVFTDNFGIEQPYDMLGLADPTPYVLEFEEKLRDALLVHDRIVDVQNYKADYNPSTGVFTIESFDVITDEEQAIPIGGLTLLPVD